jgi:hypothetical protein
MDRVQKPSASESNINMWNEREEHNFPPVNAATGYQWTVTLNV